jgi:hypothetical protein
MGQTCINTFLFSTTLEKPRVKWLHDIEDDLREQTVKWWRQKYNDEDEWTVEKELRLLYYF